MKTYTYKFFLIFILLNICTILGAKEVSAFCFDNFHNYTSKPIMDLNKELNIFKSLSGGEITITKDLKNNILVQRNYCKTRDKKNELLSRYKNWIIFKQLHLSSIPGEVFYNSKPVSKKLKNFLYNFAMSTSGALWVQKVVNVDLHLIQKKYYKVSNINGKPVINPTDDFLIDLAFSKFYIAETDSNTRASGSFIAINKNFLNYKLFSKSKQKIDHIAILSHEFGHTIFGDPKTRNDIYSEADAVARYENPVRILNNFLPRKTYYDKKITSNIDVRTKIVVKIK
ncbi:MAG: hypothetical protein HAW60_00475 [Bdellovibrionales bacterium]|nr:hypothetical protein [Bdellovibrionales bacterium]